MDKDYAQKWVCLICGSYYDTEKQAEECSKLHIEYEIEPKWVLGSEYPYRLIFKKKKGDKVIGQVIYSPISK